MLEHLTYEIAIQRTIDTKINPFLNAVPPVIDPDEPFADLKPGRNPYNVDGDVDCCDKYSDAQLQSRHHLTIWNKNGAAIDDYLQEKLHLKRPARDYRKVEGEAGESLHISFVYLR